MLVNVRKNAVALMAFVLISLGIAPWAYSADLKREDVGKVEVLPHKYPDTWIFAHDPNFFALTEGKVVVVDVASGNRHYKGAIGAAQFASFRASSIHNELYSAETFYSRGTRGDRIDFVTIYDSKSLSVIDEIPLPGKKRAQVVPEKHALQLIDNDRFLLAFNFSPAASVTVIDIKKRQIVNDVDIPGCSLIYPTGKRGFSTLCADGGMLTFQLSKSGKVTSEQRIAPFFDPADDPVFEKAVYIDKVAYFPTFKSDLVTIDFSETTPKILPLRSLVNEKQKQQKWRPGGWQIATSHESGSLYFLMHKNGFNGSHKDGGTQVWVFDAKSAKRTAVHQLKGHSVSIEVTSGQSPYLVVTNADMSIDIYNAKSGEFIRNIGGVAIMPISLHASK